MENFENAIKILETIGKQKLMESSFTLEQFVELLEAVCEQYGKERVYEALGLN